MSTTTIERPDRVTEVVVRETRDPQRPTWVARMRSADHKVIGTTLIGLSMLSLIVAGVAELLTLAQLSLPDNTFLPPERFLRLHTLADTTYLLFFALPGILGLALYALPLQIGARATAFGRLSAFGAWSIVLGFSILYASVFVNAPQTGPFLSAPLVSDFFSPGQGVDFMLASHMLLALGLTVIAIDLLTTFRNMRAAGMSRETAPAFAFAARAFSLGMLLTAPVLFVACGTLLVERQSELTGIFDPATGGSAMLWQVLYGWFAHAAPLLVGVAGVGIAADIFAAFGTGRVALRRDLGTALTAMTLLAVLGFGQLLYGAPLADAWILIFMVIGLALVMPAVVIVTSLVRTVRAGQMRVTVPVLYALGFTVLFTGAIIDAVGMAIPAIGQWLLGSEFHYAHWQFLVVGCGMMAIVGGLHYWFPKITGRVYSDGAARIAWAHIFFGTLAALLLMQSLGIDGFARELGEYSDASGYQLRWVLILLAALAIAFGVVVALVNLIVANAKGAKAGNDPWHGSTLEWFTPSPPPVHNFDSVPAVVNDAPLKDLRARLSRQPNGLAGTVAQPPSAGSHAAGESRK